MDLLVAAATIGIPMSASPTGSLLIEAPNPRASLEVGSKSDTEAYISPSGRLDTNMDMDFADHEEIEESDLFGRFLRVLQSMCRELGDVSIVLDGWDESRMDSKKDCQTMLASLSKAGCRLYITSRSEPDVSRSLSPLEIHIDPDDNDSDIVASVLRTLKAAQLLRPVRDIFPYERLARYITQISHGVFNLARIQVEILLNHRSILGPKPFEDNAFTLPTSRNLIVEQGLKTLERAPYNIAQISKAVLLMLVNSAWPISKEGLHEVIPFLTTSLMRVFEDELPEDFDIFSHLEAFITVDPGNSLIGLTLEDISEATKAVWPTPVSTMEALANMGLDYLLSNTFQSGCAQTESALVELLQDHPYLEHSCHCWAHYVRLSEELVRSRPARVRRYRKRLSFFEPDKEALLLDRTGLREREEMDTSSHSSNAPIMRIRIEDTNRSQPVLPILNTGSKERDIEHLDFYRTPASSGRVPDQPPIRMPKKERSRAEIVVQPFDSLEARQINVRRHLQLRSAELCKKANIRLVMQVLLYTNSKYLSLGFPWEEFVSWIESMSPLQLAARFGLASVVDSLSITVPDDITKADDKGATPLHAAAIGGVEGVVDFLLEKGASTAIVDAFGKTPMHYAKENGNGGIFGTLFERFCKAERGKTDAVNDLISYYASLIIGKIEGNDKRLRELALIRSVKEGKTAVVSCLVGSGVSPDCKDKYGVPVLHIAVQEGRKYPKTPELLLSIGANPSAVSDLTKESTLHIAARTGSLDLVKLLVAAGADPRAIDGQGQTVVFPALEAPDQKSTDESSQPDEDSISRAVTFLLRRGVDPNKKDNEGKQLLHKAASKGMKKLCKVLLLWGVEDINPKDNAGKTPRDYAQEGGFKELGDLFQPV
jgi:ankyrin repeat protein